MLVAVPVDGLDAVRPRHGLQREVRGQLLAAVFLMCVLCMCVYQQECETRLPLSRDCLRKAERAKHITTHPCLLETKTRTFPAPTMPPRCLLSQPHFSESSYFDCDCWKAVSKERRKSLK